MTPLRQFKGVPTDVIRKAEGKQFVSIGVFYVFLVLKVVYPCFSPGIAISI